MENLIIAGGKFTPEITFDVENKILSLTGKSLPENSAEFYAHSKKELF